MGCFALKVSSKTLVQETSLQEDCLEYLFNASYTIQCYKLSFNYVSAIGSTAGALIVGFFVLRTQAALAAKFQRDRRNFYYLEFFILLTISLTLGLALGLVDELSETAFSSISIIY